MRNSTGPPRTNNHSEKGFAHEIIATIGTRTQVPIVDAHASPARANNNMNGAGHIALTG